MKQQAQLLLIVMQVPPASLEPAELHKLGITRLPSSLAEALALLEHGGNVSTCSAFTSVRMLFVLFWCNLCVPWLTGLP